MKVGDVAEFVVLDFYEDSVLDRGVTVGKNGL
jgi:hypothetical protein